MTREVVSVYPATSVLECVQKIVDRSFTGLPVIDANNALVGIVTEYDLIHFLRVPALPDGVKPSDSLANVAVEDVMNTDPLTFVPTTTLQEILTVFRDHHRVNPVPVVDEQRKVLGIVSRYDIMKLFCT